MNTESAVLTPTATRLAAVIPLIMLISAFAMLSLYLIYYSVGKHYADRTALTLKGSALKISAGQGRIVGNALEIQQVGSQGVAFASITGITLSADRYPSLRWTIDGLQDDVTVHFIWANQTNASKMQNAPVKSANGDDTVDLKAESAWRGTIVGLGIMIKGHLSQPVVIHQLVLQQSDKPTMVALLGRFWNDWTFLESWSQRSINFIEGAPRKALMPVVPAIALWVGFCIAIYFGLSMTRRSPVTIVPVAVFILTGWLVLDARWQWNLWNQWAATKDQFSGKDWKEKRLAGEDGDLFRFILEIKTLLPAEPARIFIVSADPFEGTRYLRSRARYHLLPHNVFALLSSLPGQAQPGDYLLIFPPLQNFQYDRKSHLLRDQHHSIPVELLHQASSGALFRVQSREQ